MNNPDESTSETGENSRELTESSGPSPLTDSPLPGANPWVCFLIAAAISTVAGVVVLNQFGDHFQISQEMADIAPDSARTGDAEVAIAVAQHHNQLLVMGLVCLTTGLIFGFAGGQIGGQRRVLVGVSAGLVVGGFLGCGSVFALGMVDSVLTITQDSTTSVEQQDTQRLLQAAISQGLLFLAICASAGIAAFLGAGSRKWVAALTAIVVSTVITVAVYQTALAIVFPTEPFDRLLPAGGGVVWVWFAIPCLISAVACSRLSSK
jgi:hypothetical protein